MKKANSYKRTQPEEQGDLLALIRYRFLPYWPMFLVAALIAVAAALVYLRYTTPVYKIGGKLLVKDDKTGMDEASMLESLDFLGSKKVIDNEIEILRSRTLIREVIRHLNLFGEVVQKGQIRDVVAYTNSPVKIVFLQPDSIRAGQAVVPLELDTAGKSIRLNNVAYPLYDTVSSPWGRIMVLPNPKAPPAGKTYYLRITGEKQLTGILLSSLLVEPLSKSGTVIKMEYSDVSPERGEDIVNELIKVYNKASVEDKNRTAASTMAFVEERLRVVTGELGEVEAQVAKFKTAEGIVDIGEQSKLFLESVQQNDSKMSESMMQLSVLDAIEKYVSGKREGENIVPATLGLSDPTLLALVNKLYEVDLQRERMKKNTGENSPLLESLNQQAARLTPSIMENIRSLRSNMQAGIAKLQADNSRFMGMLKGVPAKEKALLEVSRQQAIKNNIYTFLLEKREETALAYAAAVSDSRIVDAAEAASAPFSPKRMVVLGISLLAGLASVAGFISLKDLLNREIMFRADIERATAAPIVAEILLNEDKQSVVIGDGKRTVVAEQFRILRTSLSYIGINGDHKTLLVTSSISGEGKSFISVNLAISLSLLKKKVVLLEFDLRKPRICDMMQVKREPGISNYLVGQSELANILQPLEGNDNLYLLPAGVIPPNPTELILNGQLERLLADLKARFDYVIIDTAPVGLVTDARLLAPYANVTLYVVRHRETPKFYLKMIDEIYRNKELGNLNIVFNGIKPRGASDYGSGYGYGNGYGYGYTEEKKKVSMPKRFLKGIFNI
jgi:tyrosine-protein kinase Etk/Wzc